MNIADEEMELSAAKEFLGMTGRGDWHLLHGSIRERVLSGEISRDFEAKYKAMVDEMANEREAEDDEASE